VPVGLSVRENISGTSPNFPCMLSGLGSVLCSGRVKIMFKKVFVDDFIYPTMDPVAPAYMYRVKSNDKSQSDSPGAARI